MSITSSSIMKPLTMAKPLPTQILTTPNKPAFPFLTKTPHKPYSLNLNHTHTNTSYSSNFISLVSTTSDWSTQQRVVEEDEGRVVSDWDVDGGDSGGEDRFVERNGFVDGVYDDNDDDEEVLYSKTSEEVKIFVGNLHYDVDGQNLSQLFQKAGVVETAEVICFRETGRSRGFGFVTMSSVEEADKAVEMFSGYDLNGRILTVNKAAPKGSKPERPPPVLVEPTFRAYVGNLPWEADSSRLKQLFDRHGNVVEARVVFDRETGRSRGFGFVTLSTEAELNDAVAALHEHSLDGRRIRVSVAEKRPRRHGSF